MKLDKKMLTVISTAAVGCIVLGLCLRFGSEKFLIDLYLKKYNDAPDRSLLKVVKYSGVALYIGGWLIISICLSLKHKGNKILRNSIFSVIMVSVVWSVFEYKEESFITQPKLPLLSCTVLLSSLVALISLKYKIQDVILILVAATLIIFSEFFMLPFQRDNGIIDGLGLPVLILGWFILFYIFDGDVPLVSKNLNNGHDIPLI